MSAFKVPARATMRNDLNRLEQLWSMALQNAGFGVWDLDLDLLQQTVTYSP